MNFIYLLLIGFIIGVLAKLLMPGKDPGGCIVTSVLGIAGSLVATYLGEFFGIYHHGERAGFFAAVIGAMIILAIYRAVFNKRN